jgi:uncharacterized protein (TIRG00374 family)
MNFRRITVGLLVSIVCLYFVVRGVDWGEVWQHLSQVNIPLFLAAMLLMLFAYFLMTWRWQHLLAPLELPGPADEGRRTKDEGPLGSSTDDRGPATGDGQPAAGDYRSASLGPAPAATLTTEKPQTSLGSSPARPGILGLYAKVLTGYFFNAFFPARAGDVVRSYLLGRETGLRKTTVLATIVIEKAFDGMALLLMLLLSLILLPSATSSGAGSSGLAPDLLAWVAGIGLVAVIGGLVLFYRFSDQIARLVERLFDHLPLPRRLEKLIVRLIETFANGMHVFKNPRPLIYAASISLMVWLVVALMFITALMSFSSPFPAQLMSPPGILFMTALVNLGLLVPALPGNVGTYEALCIAAMAVFKVDKELAVAFALIFHVGQLVVTLAVGAIAFWSQNLSFSEIRPVEERAEIEAEQSFEEIEHESEEALARGSRPGAGR